MLRDRDPACRARRLRRDPARLRRGSREGAHEAEARAPEEGRRGQPETPRGVPRGGRRARGRRRGEPVVRVREGPDRQGLREVEGQGLRRHDQAAQLPPRPRLARLAQRARPGLDRRLRRPRARVQGHPRTRPDGQPARDPARARGRGHPRQPAARARLCARGQGLSGRDQERRLMAASAKYIGKGSGTLALDDAVFGERFHGPLVHEAVRAELAAQRRGTASTQTRGEVSMTGAKAWRQKGTGRARVGALSSPTRTGGGVAFGPKPRSYTVKVNRKARRRALRAALSVHAERDSIAAIDPSKFDTPSTRAAAEAIAGLGGDGSVLVVLTDGEETAVKSFRNLRDVSVMHADAVGIADVIGHARLVVSEAALARLTEKAAQK